MWWAGKCQNGETWALLVFFEAQDSRTPYTRSGVGIPTGFTPETALAERSRMDR